MRIFTIGHSTRTTEQFTSILKTYDVTVLVDVRSFPRSRTNPQFNQDTIESRLGQKGVRYAWMQGLGGRRKPLGRESKNTCWRNSSFRNYADYMETDEFKNSIKQLIALAETEHVAVMCAEALYWRCHRSMIADYLKYQGAEVTHILGETHSQEHKYSECVKVIDGVFAYHD